MKAFDNVLRWLETVSYKLEIYDLDPYFWKIITCLKTKRTFLYKTTPIEFHKSCTTAVAMATMTFQDGGYFGFAEI